MYNYLFEVSRAMARTNDIEIEHLVNAIREVRSSDRKVFTFGNGGSASTANHFANDLAKLSGSINVHRAVRAVSLSQNIAIITALANDVGYEYIYSEQLSTFARKGDLVIGISCSGNSKNVVRALGVAKNALNLQTALLTGNKKSMAVEKADYVVYADHDDIRIQEDIHLAICHLIAGELRDND